MDADDLLRSESGDAGIDSAGERLIADRLEALEAEKVMQRALELEAESRDEAETITGDQLGRIAEEIGVDAAFVQQAIGEIRLAPPERSRFSRWVLPDDLFETATLSGVTREDLDASITRWMTMREGLAPGKVLPHGVDWDVDRRWRAKARSKALSGDNRISRVAGGDVVHQVHSVDDTNHVVALSSEGRWPLTMAKLLIGAGAALSAFLLVNAIGAGDVLLGIVVALAISALSVTGAVIGARWWARGIRGALTRALLGLAKQTESVGKGLLSRLRRVRRKRKK